jgi:hypothetical protein
MREEGGRGTRRQTVRSTRIIISRKNVNVRRREGERDEVTGSWRRV